jgi:hypothetical protein
MQGKRRLSSGGVSLFGVLDALDLKRGTLSILVIVGAVLFIERFFHILNRATHDSAYKDVAKSIEKELMVVGTMAFVFKCVVNSTSFLSYEWYIALEYAG